jgi:polyphosphate kinase 2 (PPK2 family)
VTDTQAERIAKLIKPLRVKPGSKVNLAKDFDPGYKAGYVKKKQAKQAMRNGITLPCDYQARLAAQDSHAVLLCLQALDAGGKDGARARKKAKANAAADGGMKSPSRMATG